MLILRVNFQAQKEFRVDFDPKTMYTSKKNAYKRPLAVEDVTRFGKNVDGAVRAVIK